MTLPTPSVEYFLLCPMLIVFAVAVAGVLVEAFLPRRLRYGAQVTLALGGLIAAFIAVVVVSRSVDSTGRSAVLGAVAIDRPALFLQGTVLLVAVMAVIFIAERTQAKTESKVPVMATSAGLDSFTPRGGAGRSRADGALPIGDAVRRRHDGVSRVQ
jgi:NADH-quinone oxidoreductase subunit N